MSKKPLGGLSIYVILGLLFIAAIGIRTISTPEIWSHLAQGKTGAPLSFVATDSAVNTNVLYDKLAYSMYNIGGAPLLIILNVLGLLITFTLLVEVAKKWGGGLSQGFALLIAGHLMFQSLDVGPDTIMLLFIALFLFLLGKLKTPVLLFSVLVPLQIIWTNLDGSFLFGPLIAGLTAFQAGQSGKGSGRNKKKQAVEPGLYGMLAGALAVSTLVNPYLFKMHAQVFANIQSPSPVYWSSLFFEYFQVPALKPLILFVLILGACGLITLKKKLPTVLTTLAIFGAFLVWTSPQTSPLFAVLAFPFIVLSLTAISEYVSGSLNSILGKQAKLMGPATQGIFIILVVLSMLPVVSNCAYVKTGSASNFGLGAQEELFPSGAEAILNHPDFPEAALNLASDGGYLAFNYDRKIFLDYRPGRYSKELLNTMNAMMLGDREAYDTIYEQYRPEAVIINTLSPTSAQGIVTLLRRQVWKLAYFDGTTAILLMNKPELESLINDTELQAAGLAMLEKARADYASKAGSCHAGNPAELIGSGKVFLAFNRPTESEAIFALLLKGNRNIPAAWIGLGNSQLMLKKIDAAVASLKIATEQAPNSWMAWASYASACKYAGNRAESERALGKARKLTERNQIEDAEKPVETEEVVTEEVSLDEITIPE